jgi:hypothetical protein
MRRLAAHPSVCRTILCAALIVLTACASQKPQVDPPPAPSNPPPSAQTNPVAAPATAPAQPQPNPSAAVAGAKIPAEQLDALVAPIALYPDPLLAQVLAASTYRSRSFSCSSG